MKTRNEAGFSLLEMIVAVAVTLVITGAVYGLIAGGNNAFRREPELTERQQNARMAMDLIVRDIANTGSGLPAMIQAFTRGLDACSASPTSPAGTQRSCPVGAPSVPLTTYAPGVSGVLPDDLELIGNPSNFEGEQTCHYPGGSSSVVRMRYGGTNIETPQVVLVMMANGTYAVVNINGTSGNNSAAGDCAQGQPHTQLDFNQGQDPTELNQPGGMCSNNVTGTAAGLPPSQCNPIMVARGEIVRYGIRVDADGVPNLYRFSSANLIQGTTGTWQLVAKGVEDLQVQYRSLDPNSVPPMQPASAWTNEPPQVSGCDIANPGANCCDPGCVEPSCRNRPNCIPPTNAALARLVTEVRVTLSARGESRNIQGGARVAGQDRVRGSLTQTVSPRATLFALSRRPALHGGAAWR